MKRKREKGQTKDNNGIKRTTDGAGDLMKIDQRGYISLFFPLSKFATSRGLFKETEGVWMQAKTISSVSTCRGAKGQNNKPNCKLSSRSGARPIAAMVGCARLSGRVFRLGGAIQGLVSDLEDVITDKTVSSNSPEHIHAIHRMTSMISASTGQRSCSSGAPD